MIVGDPSVFAIESGISHAYERASFRALGFFVIHLGGIVYGVKAPDATLLACSFDQVGKRIVSRGEHEAFFSCHDDSGEIADAVTSAIYGEASDETAADGRHRVDAARWLGVSETKLRRVIHSNGIVWAPDGDEAFDDGSSVLQFDVENRVRLIGFRRKDYRHEPSSLQNIWLEADSFYRTLSEWQTEFISLWMAAPKEPAEAELGQD